MNKLLNQNAFSTFHSHKMQLLALLGLFTDEMTAFPSFSYTPTSEIPTLSYT